MSQDTKCWYSGDLILCSTQELTYCNDSDLIHRRGWSWHVFLIVFAHGKMIFSLVSISTYLLWIYLPSIKKSQETNTPL